MTKMLDILENFMNLHGYRYVRLDGSTKPEMRQVRRHPGDRALSGHVRASSSGTPASLPVSHAHSAVSERS